MKNSACLMAATVLMAINISFAQERLLDLNDQGHTPVNTELLGTQNNEPILHFLNFGEADGYSAKVYRSILAFPNNGQPKRLPLPYPLAIKGVGYTNDYFIFLATHLDGRTEVPYARVTLIRADKQGQSVKGSIDLKLDDENDRFLFSDGGANYVITSVKKPSGLRIRRITDFNVEVFDFPMTSDQLSFWDSKSVYIPAAQTEHIPAQIDRKIFFQDGKLVIAFRSTGSEKQALLSLYEFSLTNPATFTTRPVPLPGTIDHLGFAPYENKLLVFSTAERTARIHILDFKTLQALKTFSIDNPESPLLRGELYHAGIHGEYSEKLYTGLGAFERKLPIITRFRPWIQAWPNDGKHLRVSFGDYIMSGELKEFIYLTVYLDPSTLELTPDSPALSRREYMLLRMNAERDASGETLSTYYTRENCFMLEHNKRTGTLTLWK